VRRETMADLLSRDCGWTGHPHLVGAATPAAIVS